VYTRRHGDPPLLPDLLSACQRWRMLCQRSRKREENVASLAFLSGMLPAFLCRRSIFDPLRSTGVRKRRDIGGCREERLVYMPMVFRSTICILAYEVYHKNEKSRQDPAFCRHNWALFHCDIDVHLFWMIKVQTIIYYMPLWHLF